ncbi:MAG: hypothetical protein KC416_15690, partial [Myxococcales bacterium]|nr:hypothetical protein [Myxococcales bacterium]
MTSSRDNLTPVDYDPFAEGELALTFPSTVEQRSMWASVEIGETMASLAYNESVRVRLRGHLDENALRHAFDVLVSRHDALRSTFSADGQVMCVATSGAFPLEFLDARRAPDPAARLAELVRGEGETPFDLVQGPLARGKVLRTADDEHWLLVSAHHMVCDGWSMAVILSEVGSIYSARVRGTQPELEKPGSFAEYALAEAAFFEGPDAAEVEAFWLNQFKDGVPLLDFPTDKTRPAMRSFAAERVDHTVDPALVKALRNAARKNGVSFVALLTAAWQVFVHRLTGHRDIVVALPAAGQAFVGEHYLIGHCVSTLPIRTAVDPDKPFLDLAKDLKGMLVDAFEKQQVAYGALVRRLSLSRDASRVPLAPLMFNVDMGMDDFAFEGLTAEYFSNPRVAENFELNLNASDVKHGFILECTFNTELFERDTMVLRLREFEALLGGIARDPLERIGDLPIMPD